MRKPKFWSVAVACAAFCAAPLPGSAQQPAGDAPPPPQLEKLEEGDAPAVTIRKPAGQEQKVTDKRARGGKVTEVQVSSGKRTYYLKPNDSAGSALPGDMQSNAARAAQWKVLEFGSSRTPEADAARAAAVPPPPVPATPAPK